MNILFTTSTLPRFEGDSQSPFVLEQAVAWKKARHNDNVYILAPHHARAQRQEVIEGVTIIRYQYFCPVSLQSLVYPALIPNIKNNPLLLFQLPFLLVAQLVTVIGLIRTNAIDLVYAHWIVPQGIIAYIASLLTHTPYVVHNHSSDMRVLVKIPLCGRLLAEAIIRKSKRLYVTNSILYKEAIMISKYAKTKLSIMPMGVNNKLKVRSQKLKVKTQKSKEHYDFGFIGRLTAKKGIRYFFDALLLLDVPLRIGMAGGGEEYESLHSYATHIMKEKKNIGIDFLGNVDGAEKTKFINSVRCFIFSSVTAGQDIEGMPVSLLEALAAGKLLVASLATNVQLLPEWEKLKNDIFLIEEPHNATKYATILRRVLEVDRKNQHRMEERVSRLTAHYYWDNLIKTYIDELA